MKIALVHDYLREYGGAERVLEAIHEIWPSAPLYTSFTDWKGMGTHATRFKDWDIRTSWVQNNVIVKRWISPLRFLAPKIWESFDLSEYDVVLSSSGWFMCRGVRAGQRTRFPEFDARQFRESPVSDGKSRLPLHICYIHHPPRNLYGYATGSDLQKYWPVRVYAHIVNFFLRQYDYETAQRVDYFVANSKETARRVEKFYRRESTVIYPPIDVHGSSFKVHGKKEQKREYYLSVGRLTYSKRIDLAIEACNRLSLPLKVVGAGKEEARLKELAGPTIEFVGSVSDSELRELYAGAKALLFCALDEDFGMVPVEAMSQGTPVIALAQGGVLETVTGTTGILFAEPTVECLETALRKFMKHPQSWDRACLAQAEKFSKDRFKKELVRFVQSHV